MDSQAIVNTMEVLETKPLTELVTEATVKVCYVSEMPNPNQTVIDKEAGKEIAATLPGAPVVGLFDPDTNDFVEHSRRLSIKDGEIKWEELTRPYGFVSPIHKPWYQDFIENGEIRTYLMCKAFLWTRQYKEASLINNKGQSMELDEKDMSGYYEGDVFIFTHATLDKLCILGDKYAPCFEGAKFMTTYAKGYNSLAEEVETIIGKRYYVLNNKLVEKPITLDSASQMGMSLEDAFWARIAETPVSTISTMQTGPNTYTADENLVKPIATPVPENEGIQNQGEVVTELVDATPAELATVEEGQQTADAAAVDATAAIDDASQVADTELAGVDPATQESGADIGTDGAGEGEGEGEGEGDPAPAADFAALTEKVASLEQQIAEKDIRIGELESALNEYHKKDAEVEAKAKNDMIASYKSMLSDDEMKPIIDKFSELSLDEIEAKLSVTYTRKQRSAANANDSIQVNIHAMGNADDDLPEFMKQAAEYDRTHGLNFNL